MGKSKYESIIEHFVKRPIFTAADAREAGIPSRMLSFFCDKGVIERISRGVYMGTQANLDIEFQWEDLALVAMSVPKGVVCLISALCFYELTDQMMREFWIAVPHSSKSPKRPKTRVVRMRNIELGQVKIKIGKHSLKIFDRERTVVDAFRYLGQEIAIKALQAYLRPHGGHKPDLKKLVAYAKQFRVNIQPYIMACTT